MPDEDYKPSHWRLLPSQVCWQSHPRSSWASARCRRDLSLLRWWQLGGHRLLPAPAFLAQHQACWALQCLSRSLFQSKVTSRHWEQQIFHLLGFVVSGKEWGALSGWGMGGAQGVNLGWHSWIQRKPSIQGPPVLGWEQKPVLLPKPWGAVCGPGALESGRGWCCLWCFSWTSLRTSPRSPTRGKHVPNMWNRSGLLTHQGLGMGLSWGCTVWRRSGKGCPTQIMKLFSCRSC